MCTRLVRFWKFFHGLLSQSSAPHALCCAFWERRRWASLSGLLLLLFLLLGKQRTVATRRPVALDRQECLLRWPCSWSIALDQHEVVPLGASQTATDVCATRFRLYGARKWLELASLQAAGGGGRVRVWTRGERLDTVGWLAGCRWDCAVNGVKKGSRWRVSSPRPWPSPDSACCCVCQCRDEVGGRGPGTAGILSSQARVGSSLAGSQPYTCSAC
jgi:hypothetical protein